jgi:hypothetical protein
MKIIKPIKWILACNCVIVSLSAAQPNWLKEAQRQSEGKTPPDKAGAIVLLNSADIVISADGSASTQVRQAYKILKSAGESFGTLHEEVAYFRKVKNLKGWSLSPGGRTRTLEKENIVEMGLSGISVNYTDSRWLMAKLPGAVAGAVVGFEYDIEENHDIGLFQRFVFQAQEPVQLAQLALTLPAGWQFNKTEWRMESLAFEQTGNRFVWTAKDLPYQPEEPLMPSWHFLSRRLAVTCYNPAGAAAMQFADWATVGRWCAELHQAPAALDTAVATHTRQLTKNLATPAEKLQAIAAFVRDEIRYVAVEIDKGRWQPRSAATTLHNRYGDCKDKTTLMRAMLQAVNIPSAPVLANSHYAVNPALPTPFQFNHCIIGIPLAEMNGAAPAITTNVESWLLFDPTHPAYLLGELPIELQGNFVLFATPSEAKLQRLPFHAPADNRRRYRADAVLNSDGSFTAEVKITDYKNWAAESRYENNTTPKEKQIENWRGVFSSTVPAPVISNYQTGSRGDSAWITFQLKGSRYLVQAGALQLLKTDFFHASEPSPFTAERRQHPIWYGAPRQIETDIVWQLPRGKTAEIDVPLIRNACSAADLSCETTLVGNQLRFKATMQYFGKLLPPEQYETARQFSRNFSEVQGMTVVVK